MSETHSPTEALRRKNRVLTAVCLLLWLLVTLVPVFSARSGWTLGPWPVDFWMAAQGCVLAYLLIVVVYAVLTNRWEREAQALAFELPPSQDEPGF